MKKIQALKYEKFEIQNYLLELRPVAPGVEIREIYIAG